MSGKLEIGALTGSAETKQHRAKATGLPRRGHRLHD
jgi:hypothetical protein